MGTLTELEFDALRTRHQEFMEAATRELLDRFSAEAPRAQYHILRALRAEPHLRDLCAGGFPQICQR
jgi:hypothetical protein